MGENRKTIIFLWANPVPYQLRIYEQIADWGYDVIVYHSEAEDIAPCQPESYRGVTYRQSGNLSYEELKEQIETENPAVIITTGWVNKKYKKICKTFKSRGIPTLCKIDTQYLHTLKQRIGFVISPFYLKPAYSHMLVPGVRQYYFARRLGYSKDNIILNGLSADTKLFAGIERPVDNQPKTFLFLGRLVRVKGLELLVNAWSKIENKDGWKLLIIGSGPEKERLGLNKSDDIELVEYAQQKDLPEYITRSGVYVLPSIYEAWALTIHELCSAGLPVLCSDTCGASPHFVINGYNGYTFKTADADSLAHYMTKFISMSADDRKRMGENSRKLSLKECPEFTAASILSVIAD